MTALSTIGTELTVAGDADPAFGGPTSTTREMALLISISFAAAVGAVDVPRLTGDQTIVEGLAAASLVLLFGAIAACPPALPRRWPTALLTLWIAWSFLAPIAGAPFSSFIVVSQFAALGGAAASAYGLITRAELATFFARTIVTAFGGYLLLSVGLLARGSLDLMVNDRFTLASLESNQLGRAAALAAVSGLWMLSRDREFWILIGATSAIVGGAVTLATESRTALAALGAGVILLAIHTSRARLVAFAMGAALTIAAAWVSGLVTLDDIVPATERVNVAGGDSATTLSGRETLWPQVWTEVDDAPVFGHGLGNDRAIIVDRLEVGWEALHAHNLVIHAALTTGIVGLALLLAAIIAAVGAGAVASRPFELTLLVIIMLDGISEPVVRIPAFGWLALCAAVIGVSAPIAQAQTR